MWPRIIELMLGIWLIISPLIFGYRNFPNVPDSLWATDFGAGIFIICFSLLSYSYRFRHIHFLTAAVALAMVGNGYFNLYEVYVPSAHNHIIVGLTLLLFVLLPNNINKPPRSWQSHSEEFHKMVAKSHELTTN